MIESRDTYLPRAASREATGRRIRATRLALGMKQKEVYDPIGVNKTTYSNHDTGYSRPNIEDGIRIARHFGVTLDWIYLGDLSGVPHGLAEAIKLQLGRHLKSVLSE